MRFARYETAFWGARQKLREISEIERRAFAGRQFFNAYAFEGFGPLPTLGD